jgi:DNA-binding transcriptional LysR family regulator
MPLQDPISTDDLRAFFLIAEAGGISAAARRFGGSKTSMSRALAKLEATAGSPLFDRVSGGLRLTPIGETLLDAARAATRAGSDAAEALRAAQGEPSGPLRIAASALSGQQLLGPVLARMARLHPEVRASVAVTAHGPDPLAEDLDVVLRLGRPEEPYLIARRIVASPLRLYVGAKAAWTGELRDPAAVEGLGRIVVGVPGSPEVWGLSDAEGREVRMASAPLVTVGDPTVALGILRAGAGVAFLPSVYGEPRVKGGDFMRVLPEHEGPTVEVYASFPPRRASVPAVRAFIDLLVEASREMS